MVSVSMPIRMLVRDGSNTRYLTIRGDGSITLTTGSLVPVSLSSIAQNRAAILQWHLEDAGVRSDALSALRAVNEYCPQASVLVGNLSDLDVTD